MDTGAERFLEEMNAANNSMRQVLQTQQQISTQAMSTHLLSANALNDFNNVQEKVHIVQSAMMELQNIPLYLRTDAINNQIEGIRQQMQGVGTLQSQISNAVVNMDTAGANASLQQLNDMMDSVMRNVRSINAQQITPQWQSTASVQVFQNTGAERFQAEVAAANNAMERMLQINAQVRASTASMRMLPANAQADIANIGNRMTQLTQKIQAINRIPVSMRTETLNNQLENLRGQFFQATQSAEALNRAMQGGDLSAANMAAQQLNASLGTAERTIRDNINAQNNFNQSVHQGTVAASGLESMIRRYGAAILSFAGVKKVLNLSDTLTQSNARIAMMAGGVEHVGAVQDQVFAAAQRARGNYQEMLDMVGKFGMRAGDAFTNTNETIKFAENLNKMYAIAGANQMETASATLQLTQALGSGVLRGQELNAVFNAAPNVIQTVADYMGVPIGKIRELAAEGKVTASIVKNALLSATEDIDKQFSQMPTTFGQVMNSIANQALMAFQPVLAQISDITKSDRFQSMVTGIVNGLASVASMATQVFDALATGAAFVVDNWDAISPVLYGVAAGLGAVSIAIMLLNIKTAILNSTLLKNPILAILAVIVAVITAIVTWIDKTIGLKVAWLTVVDAIKTAWDGLILAAQKVWMMVQTAFENLVLAVETARMGILNTLDSMKASGLTIIQNFVNGAIDLINDLISAVNTIAGTSFEMVGHVTWGTDAALEAAANKAARQEYLDNISNNFASRQAQRQAEFDAAFNEMIAAHQERQAEILGVRVSQSPGFAAARGALNIKDNSNLLEAGNYNTAAIADSTHDITDSLEMTREDLKAMKDIAERDYINRFTTAEVKIDIGGINNNISEAQDLDGAINNMIYDMVEKAQMSAAGYHNY